MRRKILSAVLILFSLSLWSQSTVYINEISYKDAIASDRGVELTGPAGTNITNWSMDFIEDNGTVYHTETIISSTVLSNQTAGKDFIWIPVADLQQNDNRTIILYDNNNVPMDTISYGANPFSNYSNEIIGVNVTSVPLVQDLALPGYTPQNLQDNSEIGWWLLQPASKGFVNANQVVPVELVAFRAALIKRAQIMLNWQTESEMFNSHFEIEKSTDGMTFSQIGSIEGAGTTIENQYYEFTDIAPKKGVNYYRLKQVDFDGKFEYSMIVSVEISEEASIVIAPNPVRQNSELTIFANDLDNYDFVLMDMTGKIVKSYQGLNDNIIQITDLNPALYIYQIRKNNQLIKMGKLVIIR
jgi:hypothetical protein